MTQGPTGPEYIPSKEEQRRNRERARAQGKAKPTPKAAPETVAVESPSGTEAQAQPEPSPVAGAQSASVIAEASNGGEDGPVEVRGVGGVVSFDGQFVTITHKGFLGRLSVGKGQKRIPLASITAVQLKPAGSVVNGFIQFTVPGGNEQRSSFGQQTFDAAGDENSMVFTKAQMPQFVALRDQIEQTIADRFAPQAPASVAPNPAEQIQQLAALRDQGILTEEEFDAKKSELLSRM